MAYAFYVSHPEVTIDPAVPVPRWSLSDRGRRRLHAVARDPWVRTLTRVIASDETKAIETAEILARACGATVGILPSFGENDRSATGFLPPPEFEVTASAFFADPQSSIRGWERAIDAQSRIIRAVNAVLDTHDPAEPIAFSGHGGVGTLAYCWFAGLDIDRRHDQTSGGNIWVMDLRSRRPLFGWTPLESVTEKLGTSRVQT